MYRDLKQTRTIKYHEKKHFCNEMFIHVMLKKWQLENIVARFEDFTSGKNRFPYFQKLQAFAAVQKARKTGKVS